jgi:hypothetical protein
MACTAEPLNTKHAMKASKEGDRENADFEIATRQILFRFRNNNEKSND